MKHVSGHELSSPMPSDGPHDSTASQRDPAPVDFDVKNVHEYERSIHFEELIISDMDETSSPAEPIEFDCVKDVEKCEAENEMEISGNAIRVEIDSPPLDDNYDRNESPPSLELATGKFSDNECDMNEVNDDFDDFQRNSNEQSVDTVSLPSLNFDSIRNSPDFKSEEIDEKKSEPIDDEAVDDKVTTTSSELFDGEPPPTPPSPPPTAEPDEASDPIEITDEAVVDSGLPNGSIAFDADFSQFSAFENESGATQQPPIEPQPIEELKRPVDDDDFGDFEEAPAGSSTIDVKSTLQETAHDVEAGDDDDFGDFNDFQQDTAGSTPAQVHTPLSELPKSTSFDLKTISERFKTILDTVFPSNGEDDDSDISSAPSNDTNSTNKIDHFLNGTSMHLKNFENAKALQHQWTNSTGKNVLIKALGIDARNVVS